MGVHGDGDDDDHRCGDPQEMIESEAAMAGVAVIEMFNNPPLS